MKTLLVITFAGLNMAGLRAGEDIKVSVRQRMLDNIVHSMPPIPTSEYVDEAAPPAGGDVVKMEAFVISEEKYDPNIQVILEQRRRKIEDEKFSPVKGGTLYKTKRIEVGGWFEGGSWRFLRFSW